MAWFKRKPRTIPGRAPSNPAPPARPAVPANEGQTLELRPPADVVALGEEIALGPLHVTVESVTFREPPLRVRREHPGARWLMASVAVENRGAERQRMPDLRVAGFDGSVGVRELCEEPGDFDGLYWLEAGVFVESLIFFALEGTAGGIIEAIDRDTAGPTGDLGRWRFAATP